jgi:hypothetical protein
MSLRVRLVSKLFTAAALVVGAFTLASARPIAAQEMRPGVRVRNWVSPPGEWHTGTLVRFGIDSLVLKRCPDCAPEAQPLDRLTRVEVSEGRTWSGRHMAIGALVVGGVAALIAKRQVDRDQADCSGGPCGIGVVEIPIAGVAGAITGTIVGALWRVESWREIYGN